MIKSRIFRHHFTGRNEKPKRENGKKKTRTFLFRWEKRCRKMFEIWSKAILFGIELAVGGNWFFIKKYAVVNAEDVCWGRKWISRPSKILRCIRRELFRGHEKWDIFWNAKDMWERAWKARLQKTRRTKMGKLKKDKIPLNRQLELPVFPDDYLCNLGGSSVRHTWVSPSLQRFRTGVCIFVNARAHTGRVHFPLLSFPARFSKFFLHARGPE